jgi:hypothetical protein
MSRHSTKSKLSNNTSALHNLEKDDDFAMYRENYLFMKQSPMYVRLEQKYKELKKRCREQQTMIDMLNRQQYELMERVVRAQAGVLNVPNVFVSEPVLRKDAGAKNEQRRTSYSQNATIGACSELPVVSPTIKTEKVAESAPVIEYSELPDKAGANDNDTQNIVFVESQKPVPVIVAIEDVVYEEVVEEEEEEEVVDEEQVEETEEVDEEEETEEVEVVEEGEELKVVDEEEVVEEDEGEEVEVVEEEETEEVEVVDEDEGEEVEVVEEEEVEVVEEEETEEVEEVEEETEEVEVVEEETEEVEVVEEEEEEGVYEKEINGTRYYITNDTDGTIYEMLDDEEIGQIVGSFVNGKPVFK